MDKVIGFILLIAVLSMCDSSTKTVTTGPGGATITTTTTTVGSTTFLKRAISWLRIAELVQHIFEGEEKVVVRSKDSNGPPVDFYPVRFVQRHGIEDEFMVVSLDEKITNILRQCTQQALDTGASSDRKLREYRISCLEQRGFDENDKTYTRIKHPGYWI